MALRRFYLDCSRNIDDMPIFFLELAGEPTDDDVWASVKAVFATRFEFGRENEASRSTTRRTSEAAEGGETSGKRK